MKSFQLLLVVCVLAPATFASRLTNLSVRSDAGSGSATLIVGFAVGGSGTKSVLLRGIGPSLSQFNVPGVVTNPRLDLYANGVVIGQNDNWGGGAQLANAFTLLNAFPLTANSEDAALLQSVPVGTYTAQLGAASGDGIALVECYDAELTGSTARLVNVSARSISGVGAKVLTVGFTVFGDTPLPVLIRGIGPTLSVFSVSGTVTTARLRLFNSTNVQIGDNDGWLTSVTPPELFDTVGAFRLPSASRDGVLFLALPPGTYTAQVSGSAGTAGAALIEVYEITNSPVSYITLQPVSGVGMDYPDDPGSGATLSPGADSSPVPLTQALPQYPFELRRASITGEVVIDFYVKTDGTVANATAIRATDVRMATSALNAVRQWTFAPGRRNGRLMTTHMQVPIVYMLN